MSSRKGLTSRSSSSSAPFDFDLYRNQNNNKIEIKTNDEEGSSALNIPGKFFKKSIHTVGELASKVPTKVLRSGNNGNEVGTANSQMATSWSPIVPSKNYESKSNLLASNNYQIPSNSQSNHNNNNHTSNNYSSSYNNSNTYFSKVKLKDKEKQNQMYLIPGTPLYPHYNQISSFSDSQIDNIPPLLAVCVPSYIFSSLSFDPKVLHPNFHSNELYNPIHLIAGPENGLFECIEDIPNRRAFLMQLKQQLVNNMPSNNGSNNNNNNNNNSNNSNIQFEHLEAKEQLNIDEIKRKIIGLNKIEKKLKKIQHILNKAQNENHSNNYYYHNNNNNNLSSMNASELRIYGKTVDSYAFDYIKNKKVGDPNCDSYFAQTFDSSICFCVADGIGWGYPSRRAAQSALLGFMIQFNSFISKTVNSSIKKKKYNFSTLSFARSCKKAIDFAQLCVFSNTEAKTTIAGGIISPLSIQSPDAESTSFDSFFSQSQSSPTSSSSSSPSSSDDDNDCNVSRSPMSKTSEIKKKKMNDCLKKSPKRRGVFVGFSVGDSLIYRYSSKNEQVIEITSSDRSGGMRDAGGNLGGPQPDLSNLHYYCCLVEEGDLLIAVSDGVHDNLDPEVLKIPPTSSPHLSWNEINPSEKANLKREFKEDRLLEIIEDINDDDLTPFSVSNAVIDYVLKTTADHREAYELGSKLQRDWNTMEEKLRLTTNQYVQQKLKHPVGKFDHVTCLTVKVGFNPATLY